MSPAGELGQLFACSTVDRCAVCLAVNVSESRACVVSLQVAVVLGES